MAASSIRKNSSDDPYCCRKSSSLNIKKEIEEIYLEKVDEGSVDEVEVLFEIIRDESLFEFDRNIVDQNEKSALVIAIENKDVKMCKVLLDNQVRNFTKGKKTRKLPNVNTRRI